MIPILPALAAIAAAAQPAGTPAAPQPAACAAERSFESLACRAVAAGKERRFAEAADHFEQAAALAAPADPAHARALAAAGNMWLAAGQAGKAALALDRALATGELKAEQHGLALLDRARVAETQGDLKLARAKVSEAARTISEDPFLWYFSAALALREEDIPAAKSAINRALAMAPDSPEVLFEAGHIAKAGGEEARAREYWNRAILLQPNGPTARLARQALAMSEVPLTVGAADRPAAKPAQPAEEIGR